MVIVKHRAVTAGQKIDAMESKSDGEGGVHAKQLQKEQRRGRRQLVHGKPLCFAPTVTTWEPSCNGGHQPTHTSVLSSNTHMGSLVVRFPNCVVYFQSRSWAT